MAKKIGKKKRQTKKKKMSSIKLIDGTLNDEFALLEDDHIKYSNEKEKMENDNKLLSDEIAVLKDGLLRKAADFENSKKIMKKEMDSKIKTYAENIFIEIIDILDNFDRAIEHFEKSDNNEEILKGIKLIDKNFHELLDKFEVKTFSSMDKKFDPTHHEAVSVKNDNSKKDGIVLEELAKGYTFKKKTLRPAKVIVNQIIDEEHD